MNRLVCLVRKFPVAALASVLGAGGGEPLSIDLAVRPEPKPRLLVTAAGYPVFATPASTLATVPSCPRDAAAER